MATTTDRFRCPHFSANRLNGHQRGYAPRKKALATFRAGTVRRIALGTRSPRAEAVNFSTHSSRQSRAGGEENSCFSGVSREHDEDRLEHQDARRSDRTFRTAAFAQDGDAQPAAPAAAAAPAPAAAAPACSTRGPSCPASHQPALKPLADPAGARKSRRAEMLSHARRKAGRDRQQVTGYFAAYPRYRASSCRPPLRRR